MKYILLIAGGAAGTLARYAVSGIAYRYFDGSFPYGTMIINVTGSFIVGLVWAFIEQGAVSASTRTFIVIGILGGFTTFSTYAVETVNMLRVGAIKSGVLNILLNNILSLMMVVTGFIIAKGIMNVWK